MQYLVRLYLEGGGMILGTAIQRKRAVIENIRKRVENVDNCGQWETCTYLCG
jgi:hypothetical protein